MDFVWQYSQLKGVWEQLDVSLHISLEKYIDCAPIIDSGEKNILIINLIKLFAENFMTGYRLVFDRENKKLAWSHSNCESFYFSMKHTNSFFLIKYGYISPCHVHPKNEGCHDFEFMCYCQYIYFSLSWNLTRLGNEAVSLVFFPI